MSPTVNNALKFIKDHLQHVIKGIDEITVTIGYKYVYNIIILIDGKHVTISLDEYDVLRMFHRNGVDSQLFEDLVSKVNKAIEAMFLFNKTSFNYSEL